MNHYIKPNWPAPKNIKAYTTTRKGGVSKPPYDSFNLTSKTGDNPNDVLKNRKQLIQELSLPQKPFWLKQEHTDIAINLDGNPESNLAADSSFTTISGPVCAVLTADCVPILVCDTKGTIVSAIHAGWKGIERGIVTSTIKEMNIDPKDLMAWLGPAIGPKAFEIGPEIRESFCQKLDKNKDAFTKHNNKFLANIYMLASLQLNQAGVTKIYGGEYCTYSQKDLFYSFRRDGEKSGRFVSLIWLEQ